MRTSVKKTSLNSASPVIWKSGRTSTPGAFMSTRKAVMPLCLGTSGLVRAMMQPEGRDVGQGGPDLLPVQHPLVAVALGPGRQAGHVGAGAGLAEELAPDLLVGEQRTQVALLLLGRPVRDDGRRAHAVADGVAHPGCRGATRVEPRLRPLLVLGREAEAAAVGREVHPGQAPVELLAQELLRRRRGGREVGQQAVNQFVDVRAHARTL